ncbi:MAG: hypothetical protein ACI90V_012180, partial [Bacillariaceae sp.]
VRIGKIDFLTALIRFNTSLKPSIKKKKKKNKFH